MSQDSEGFEWTIKTQIHQDQDPPELQLAAIFQTLEEDAEDRNEGQNGFILSPEKTIPSASAGEIVKITDFRIWQESGRGGTWQWWKESGLAYP